MPAHSNVSLVADSAEIKNRDPEHAAWNDLHRRKPTDKKRTLGIFYTPTELSRCLTEWAIISGSDTVLEPSFGGCGFLNESVRVLRQFGCKEPWRQLCGCDKDLRAFLYLPARFRKKNANRRFLHNNFLETTPSDYCIKKFSVVIGNPPYVSRHNMRKYQLGTVDEIHAASGSKISRRASLWVYFLTHSLNFLCEGGRMAWVLPRSLSQANYGKTVLSLICKSFKDVVIVSVQERLFVTDGADELVDVLLCKGFTKQNTEAAIPLVRHAASIDELKKHLNEETSLVSSSVQSLEGREALLSKEQRKALDDYGRLAGFKRLGEVATITIGIVTGMARYFLLNRGVLHSAGLEEWMCTPILTRASYARGLSWRKEDIDHWIKSNKNVLLVRSDLNETKHYWDKIPKTILENNITFKRRERAKKAWHAADDWIVPDAFFFPLVGKGPRLLLNHAALNCTNSLYRVVFKENLTKSERQLFSLMFLSSYSQCSGELVGRVCSGGLKFEPCDAVNLKVTMPAQELFGSRLDELWPKIDLLLRNGLEQEAIECVDSAAQETISGLTSETIMLTQSALKTLRLARKS